MVLPAVCLIQIYQLACYASQRIILHRKTKKVSSKLFAFTGSQSQYGGPAKQIEPWPDPPASTADLPSRQAYRQTHQCSMLDFSRTDREMDKPVFPSEEKDVKDLDGHVRTELDLKTLLISLVETSK